MRFRSTHVQKNQLRSAPIEVSAYCSICSRVRRVQSEASDQYAQSPTGVRKSSYVPSKRVPSPTPLTKLLFS